MRKVIELPDSIYSALERAAETTGTTPAGWIAAQLADNSTPSTSPPESRETLGSKFAGRFGVFASDTPFRKSDLLTDLETKQRAGHL
jgi:hypothetical protein